MKISSVVNVNISRATPGVQQAGFGRGLILGSTQAFAERFRLYSDPDALLADGFSSSDPEYIAAVEYFEQPTAPQDVLVGRRLAPVAQVKNVEVHTVTDNHDYILTLNGQQVLYHSSGSASASEIRDGLIAFITASFGELTAAIVDGTNLSVTALNAGESFVLTSGDTALVVSTTTPNQDVAEDMTQIRQTSALGDSWYALMLTSRILYEQKQAADYIESAGMKFAGFGSSSANALSATGDDIGIYIKTNGLNKSFAFYNGQAASKFPEAAMFGEELPRVPGSSQYALKTLVGIVADNLTDTQIANLKSNNYMYYVTVGGVDVTFEGKVGSGEWIDVIIGIDWMTARISEAVFGQLVGVPKVPFTDPGISIVCNQITSVLKQAEVNGLLEGIVNADGSLTPAFAVSPPLASSYTSAQRASRILSGVPFTGHLAGAIIYADINGNVTN